MENSYYSTIEDVKQYTGIKANDLGFKDDGEEQENPKTADEKFDEWLEKRLVEIKSLIDADRNRDYHNEVDKGIRLKIPEGIHHIALRMMSNLLAQAVLRRETPVIQHDDYTIKMVEDHVFTKAIKTDLSRFPKKPEFSFIRVNTQEED